MNWLLYGGIAALAYFVFLRKPSPAVDSNPSPAGARFLRTAAVKVRRPATGAPRVGQSTALEWMSNDPPAGLTSFGGSLPATIAWISSDGSAAVARIDANASPQILSVGIQGETIMPGDLIAGPLL